VAFLTADRATTRTRPQQLAVFRHLHLKRLGDPLAFPQDLIVQIQCLRQHKADPCLMADRIVPTP
jgi:hypothetical protein